MESRICLSQELIKLFPRSLLGRKGGQHAHISTSQRQLLVSSHILANRRHHALLDQEGGVGPGLFQGWYKGTEDFEAVFVAVIMQTVFHEVGITVCDRLFAEHVVFLEDDSLRKLIVRSKVRRRE